MNQVKVKQGRSVCDGGIWYHQAAVFIPTQDHGKDVEPTSEAVNTPDGLVPSLVQPAAVREASHVDEEKD